MTDTRDVFLCDGVRTPIGRYGGALAKVRTDDLAAAPIKALVKRHSKVDWLALDEVVLGCANQAGEDNRNVARMALLLAGLPATAPGGTLNRLCGSGMDAIGVAARAGGFPTGRRDPRHDAGLAVRQSAAQVAIRHRLHGRDRRERGRGIPGLAR